MSRQPNSVQRDTYIRANYNKKKIKQPDFSAEAPESNSYKYEAGNAGPECRIEVSIYCQHRPSTDDKKANIIAVAQIA